MLAALLVRNRPPDGQPISDETVHCALDAPPLRNRNVPLAVDSAPAPAR